LSKNAVPPTRRRTMTAYTAAWLTFEGELKLSTLRRVSC
jgi:hypothetical protein